MKDAEALQAAIAPIATQHGRQHVGLVLGAVTSSGARSVTSTGRLRAPDGPEPGADRLFEIGSVTKVFTALLLADAVTRGELSLDTPVADLLDVAVRPATALRSPSSTWRLTPRACLTTDRR